jgi:GTP 3',8-cyclase
MKDGFDRNIDYLRISITDLCNLRCQYCMPQQGIPKKHHKEIISYEEIISIVKEAANLGVTKIRLTGGEPLIRKGVVSFISRLSAIEGIEDIAMTTNGMLLAPLAIQLRDAGLKRVNISLDSLNPDIYSQITGGGDVNKVLKAIDKALEVGMGPIKINMVVVGGINDHEVETFAALTLDKDIYVRFIELMPIGVASGWSRERFISNDEIKGRLKGLTREINQDHGGPAKYYKYPGAKGKVGFISAISSHFCNDCNRIRLTSDGKIKPCLHSAREIDLRDIVNNSPQKLPQVLQKAILLKPQRHHLNTNLEEQNNRNMFEIGG